MDYFDDLEEKVKATTRKVAALRKENRSLKTKLKKAEAGGGRSAAERDRIRDRVDRLAGDLERLL